MMWWYSNTPLQLLFWPPAWCSITRIVKCVAQSSVYFLFTNDWYHLPTQVIPGPEIGRKHWVTIMRSSSDTSDSDLLCGKFSPQTIEAHGRQSYPGYISQAQFKEKEEEKWPKLGEQVKLDVTAADIVSRLICIVESVTRIRVRTNQVSLNSPINGSTTKFEKRLTSNDGVNPPGRWNDAATLSLIGGAGHLHSSCTRPSYFLIIVPSVITASVCNQGVAVIQYQKNVSYRNGRFTGRKFQEFFALKEQNFAAASQQLLK